jgi:hypothetical protein
MPSTNVGGPSSAYSTQFFSNPVVQVTPSLTVDSLLEMLSNNGQGVLISNIYRDFLSCHSLLTTLHAIFYYEIA